MMMKSKKQELINKLNSITPYIQLDQYTHGQQQMTVKHAIEQAMKQYIDNIVITLVNDIYTTEEFEEDLTLK